jgi:gas vesicle protein
MRRIFSFVAGTLLGGIIGALLALLFTPQSGIELRAKISERTKIFSNEVRQAANTRRIELQERLETLRGPRA